MGKRIRCKKLALGKPFLQSGSTRAGSSSSIGRNYSAAKPRRELSEVLGISKMRVKSIRILGISSPGEPVPGRADAVEHAHKEACRNPPRMPRIIK